MLRGIYLSATGMSAGKKYLDMVSNNITNANTPGFRAKRASVSDFGRRMMHRLKSGGAKAVGTMDIGPALLHSELLANAGSIQYTGRALDVATSEPNVFLGVQEGAQMAYIKSGSLSISPEGYLVDGSGNRVMGADGAVQFEEGTAVEQVRITADGSVLVDNQEFAQVALYEVDLQQADWTDGGLVAADADAAVLLEQPGNVVIGGALEQANVDITRELTELIRASRMYQVNQTTLKVQDKAAKIASTSVGEG